MWRDDCTLHGMPGKRPPRLLAFNYTGCHAYFLTICTLERRTVFDDQNHAESALDQLLRAAADYQFEIIAYCLMPTCTLWSRDWSMTPTSVDLSRCTSSVALLGIGRARMRACGRRATSIMCVARTKTSRALRPTSSPIRSGPPCVESPAEYAYLGSPAYSLESLIDAVQVRPGWRP